MSETELFKRCTKCGLEKSFSAFQNDKYTPTGKKYACKACCNKRGRELRRNPERLARAKKHREKMGSRDETAEWRAKNELKIKCRRATREAVKKGILAKGGCEKCGTEDVEAHHSDYTNHMKVNWLCQSHHNDEHRFMEARAKIEEVMSAEDYDTDTHNAAIAPIVNFIAEWGGVDGGHHKQWVLDQLIRLCKGDGYAQWVEDYEGGEDGPETYSWDEGIAP